MIDHYDLCSCCIIRRTAALIFFGSLFSVLCIAEQPSRGVSSIENGGLRALALTLENRAKSQDFVSRSNIHAEKKPFGWKA